MTQAGKQRPRPKLVRTAAIVWMGFMGLAAIVTFAVILIALGNRNGQTADQGTATLTPTVYVLPTLPDPTNIPSGDTGTQTPGAFPTPSTVGFDRAIALGGQVPGFIANPVLMHQTGMTWVKYQIKWNPSVAPETAQALIQQGRSSGFKVLLSIAGDPYPQSIDYAGFVSFLEKVAAYQPDAIEVWNEMNLTREWPEGQIDPAAYVTNMLAPAYARIKAISPNTEVIIGALAPTGVDDGVIAWSDQRYTQGLYAAGAASYADCIGAHHNSGTTSPSVRSGRPEGDHYSWYFLPTIEVYYNGMNGALPVCITEFGYLTPEGIAEPLPQNFAWGANTTVAQQSAWLAEGVQIAQDLGYVPLVIVWNVDFTNWGADDPFKGYAILRPDGTCPACASLRAVLDG
jgi:hypothetical protein